MTDIVKAVDFVDPEVTWISLCESEGLDPAEGKTLFPLLEEALRYLGEDEEVVITEAEVLLRLLLDEAPFCECGEVIGGTCNVMLADDEEVASVKFVPPHRRGTVQTLGGAWGGLADTLKVHFACIDHIETNLDGTPDEWVSVEG